ncbi:MAG: M56 family metallopeptidase [Pseudomonadota bacterium]
MSWIAGNLLVASLLILVVLAIRRPVARHFGARAAYALWLAPALRLVWPPMPSNLSPTPAAGEAVTWVLETSRSIGGTSDSFPWLLAIWIVGAMVALAFHLASHHHFMRKALAVGRPFPVDGTEIDTIATAAVDGPMATGLIHPLLVPDDFEQRFTPEQRRFALLHEQYHHERGDIWASAVALLTASILWFNPFAWLALGAFRRDMESACDASLLSTAGADAAPAYAETILRCAARPVPRSLCALTSIDELKGRLTMLASNHKKSTRIAGLMLAGGLVLGGTLAVPAMADEPKTTQTTEIRKVIHNGPAIKGATRKDGQEMKVDCPGELTVIEATAGDSPDKKEKAKMVFCSKSGDKTEMAAGLEKALSRIEGDKEMNAALRADVSAKLRARIAELRSGG